jgi:hypothetical protein
MRGVQTGRCGGAHPGEGEGLVLERARGSSSARQMDSRSLARTQRRHTHHRRHLGLGTLVLVTAHIGSQRFDIVN